ncbi:MAG: aldo/keto reductase [Erythrobacter sp.]|nr:aldo/keto reductase [Erythrobacter sp.]
MSNHTNRKFKFANGQVVDRIGFGAMRLTGQPGNFGPFHDWDGGKALLRRAYQLGIRHIDTARAYGPGFNERLIAEALQDAKGRFPADLLIASKGGVEKDANGIRRDTRPQSIARHLRESLANLRTDHIGLYYVHAPDGVTPLAASVEVLEDARRAGTIGGVGLSNVSRADVEAALEIAPIMAVQNRYSPADPFDPEQEALIDWLAELGIAYVPHGPLGAHPMRNGAATDPGSALRTLLTRAPNILAIPGTTSRLHLDQNAAVTLSARSAELENV